MDEIKMEREIKEMLHQCADELHAPDSMQARVKFALNNAPARKIGEYTFSYGSDVDTTARNGVGETEKIAEVDATYTKDGAELNLSAHKSYTVFTEDEMENPVPATTAEVNGVTLTYRDAHYRFVPGDYEKSDEEKQQEKSGELVISYYGSDEVEDKMFQSVLWEQDGVTYLISGYDTGLDAQTMFDMAAELVK